MARSLLAGVLAAALLGALPATAEAEPEVRLSFASTFPGDMALIGEGALLLPERIARASGGEIALEFHEPGALVPAADTLYAVSRGEIDAGWGGAG